MKLIKREEHCYQLVLTEQKEEHVKVVDTHDVRRWIGAEECIGDKDQVDGPLKVLQGEEFISSTVQTEGQLSEGGHLH